MKTLADNKRAWHDFEILEKFQAGLVLTGAEVKSAKLGRASLQGAYVLPRGSALWLTGMNIAAYAPAKGSGQELSPDRDRKLLLNRRELDSIIGRLGQGGLTVVPLSLYTTHGLVKIELGLGRGKTKYDKRATIKKRETDREIRSSLKLR